MAFQIGESGSVTLKAVLIGVIVLLLLVPLGMLRGLVSERSALREQAYTRVAEGWGGNVVLGGPMLVVPTQRTIVERINDKEVARILRSDFYLLPARLDMKVDLKLQDEPRYVGIYAVPVYLADVQFSGRVRVRSAAAAARPARCHVLVAREPLALARVRSAQPARRERGAFRRPDRQARTRATRLSIVASKPASISRSLRRLRRQRSNFARSLQAAAASRYCRSAARRRCKCIRTGRIRRSTARSCRPSARSPRDGFDARWQVLELNRSYRQVWSEFEINEAMRSTSPLSASASIRRSTCTSAASVR